jgi:hypothetical protein
LLEGDVNMTSMFYWLMCQRDGFDASPFSYD